jgi:murein DD-endopeptidase MepM/ murein hydrolase activator NlpD
VAAYAGLYQQLSWAANQLNDGYYGWKGRAMMTFRFKDYSRARIGAGLNAGTVGAEEFLARDESYETWQKDVSAEGFMATYRKWFGDPFRISIEIMPARLIQPALTLPWPIGEEWYFTGGPHGGWASGAGWAAIDFTPPDMAGCWPSEHWVVSMSAGLVVRSESGEVMINLDGSGHEQSGWAILYMHMADEDRVAVGTKINAGDHIGHPSCTGGAANATHVHLARRYNGEWIPAAGSVPLVLDGWQVSGEATEYDGSLAKDNQVKVACECRDEAKAGITR